MQVEGNISLRRRTDSERERELRESVSSERGTQRVNI